MTAMTGIDDDADADNTAEVAGYPNIRDRGPEGDWQRAMFTVRALHKDFYDIELAFARAWADAIDYEIDSDGLAEVIKFTKDGEIHDFEIEHGWEDDYPLRELLHAAIAQRDARPEPATPQELPRG
jgi:hypothetical protein